MIDTDKMKAAFAATPLCQHQWTSKDGDQPTKLCAISALVSFAGVQPDLIQKMQQTEKNCAYIAIPAGHVGVPLWVQQLAVPVLRAEYGVPSDVALQFPTIFDRQENEWTGVTEVLALCERHNMDELHEEALAEHTRRFASITDAIASITDAYPVTDFAPSFYAPGNHYYSFGVTGATLIVSEPAPPPTVEHKTALVKSKFWTAPAKNYLPKHLPVTL